MKRAIVLFTFLLTPACAFAQSLTPIVVSACGAQTYHAGQSYPMTMDTTGTLCAANLYGAKVIPVLHQTGTTPATTDPITGMAIPAQPIMTPVTTTDPTTGAVTQVMQTVPGYFGILELPDAFALPTIPPGVAIEPIPSDSPVVFS